MKKLQEFGSRFVRRVNDAPIGKLDLALLAVLLVFMYFTFFYQDMAVILKHSLTFLDSVFHLDAGNFYGNTLKNHFNGVGAVYYWTVYLVIGLWNLPIYLLDALFGINTMSAKCFLWAKLELVAFLVLAIYMLDKIMKQFGFSKGNRMFARFMFASSLMVVLPVFSASQIDIITVFLILWGIYEYLKADRINWKFLLIFSFAGSLKIFALFVFIPLVLLREKRILYVLRDVAAGFLFVLLCILPYGWRADYQESTSLLNVPMIEHLFQTGFPGGNAYIPAFTFLLAGIGIWAYLKEAKSAKEYLYYANWIALAVFADFFLFVHSHPYWIILMAPFMILALMLNCSQLKVNMILEFFTGAMIMFYYVCTFGVYATENNFRDLILPKIGLPVPKHGYESFSKLAEGIGMIDYMPVFFGLFAACIIAFVIINFPGRVVKGEALCTCAEKEVRFDHGMLWLRLLSILGYILLTLYICYIN